ncbi:MAG: phosphoribosyltransferase family protein [Pseudomonadota bacterium]
MIRRESRNAVMLQLDWTRIDALCDVMARTLSDRLGSFSEEAVIVAVSRGGLIPATLIAHRLGVRRVQSLGLMSYADGVEGEQGGLHRYGPLPERADLVIDDIADSGKTAEAVRAIYPDAPMAALVDKTGGAAGVIAALERPAGEWVDFPWEQ